MGKFKRQKKRSKRKATSSKLSKQTSSPTSTTSTYDHSTTYDQTRPSLKLPYPNSAKNTVRSFLLQFIVISSIILSLAKAPDLFSWVDKNGRGLLSLEFTTPMPMPMPNANAFSVVEIDGFPIPEQRTGPMEQYPNPINITPEIQQLFHPVVKYPTIWSNDIDDDNDHDDNNIHEIDSQKMKKNAMTKRRKKVPIYKVMDHTHGNNGDAQLIAPEEQDEFRKNRKIRYCLGGEEKGGSGVLKRIVGRLFNIPSKTAQKKYFTVGRYDEYRVDMYTSDLFDDGSRNLHIGIDLGAPVGYPIYSFWDGNVHSLGYNDAWGDYGYVIVIEYDIPTPALLQSTDSEILNTLTECDNNEDCTKERTKIWVLYGHLSSSILKKKVGQPVKRGQMIGRLGDVHENGGWGMPHVHIAVSMTEPPTHDMPGTVRLVDRARALVDYPDPRLILGKLY